ncbi:reversion-inducing cysteine-rich protein with Kazal motifs [Thrips palmi]|uniref:Reversion-inducing cysteine-rich protein with Kazal motifs n=1 Tax=Thrips palmi TaxID=161013 RepID=A0A6P8Z520_THRPL|nr:reversion-inducing cysteine-rich protein with Kazal motifs [Thrips palmi]
MRSLLAFVGLLAAAGLVLPAPTDGSVLPAAEPGRRQRRFHDAELTENGLASLSPNAARREDPDTDDDEDDEEILSPHQFAECCGLAADPTCRQACLSALGAAGGATLGKVLDAVQQAGCGLMLHDPTDAGRLHCCGLARASACRRACQKAFRHDWGAAASGGPLQDCVNRANESALASCLAEVDYPCRPASACAGLDFCAGVLRDDGRSWFRTCGSLADAAARHVASQWWRDGVLTLSDAHLHVQVPLLRGVESCHRGLWTALACLTHAQPCSPRAGALPLCLQDCLRLLPRCVRWSAVPPGFSAEQLCAQLAGPPPCVPIPAAREDDEVAADDPEPPTAAARRQPGAQQGAAPDGDAVCRLGAASDVSVAVGAAVRVPREGSSSPCYTACLCEAPGERGAGAALGRCVDLPCLPHANTCALGQSTVEHRRTVVQGCLVCTCSSGDVLCTQRPCALAVAAASSRSPCGCPPHRVPVCGRNGRTYDNACLARCAGLAVEAVDDMAPGPCPALDPCAATANATRCPANKRCLPDRRLCLSLLAQPCPQFKCVEAPPRCDRRADGPVCDTAGRTHANECSLLLAGASLRHRGACVPGGPVCGADGYTYPSRGAAEEALVLVDYAGKCAPDCGAARCPALPPGCKRGVRAWGACCDACVGVLHAAVNTKALDKAVLAVGKLAEPWPRVASVFSLRALLGQLQELVLEACAVRGHVTRTEQLVVVLRPGDAGDAASVRACYKEAERLAGLFEQSGARVQASLLLSAVVAVDLMPAPVLLADPDKAVSPDAAPVGAVRAAPLSLVLLLLLLHLLIGALRSER